MTKRMILALGTGLVFLGSTFAQAPAPAQTLAADPFAPPPAVTETPATTTSPLAWGPGCEGDSCPTGQQFWVTGEYVLAWFDGDHLPPLVTTSPAGTAQTAAGVLGSATTTSLFGAGLVNTDVRSGFRVGAGYWFDPERTGGVEAGFTMTESQAALFTASSGGTPILARPYTDATTGMPASVLIAFPGVSSGAVNVRAASDNFYEAHIDYAGNLTDTHGVRLDVLAGYRFYRYDEDLQIRQTVSPINPNVVAGSQLMSEDDFGAKNSFHGADFGLRTQFTSGDLSVELLTKLAVGAVTREVNISGVQVGTVPGAAPLTQVGGIYALTSNIGNHSSTDYAIMPEFGANLSYRITPNVCGRIGYSIFMLSQVARAADQIDTTVNPNLFPPVGAAPAGPSNPAFNLNRSDVWVQTLNLGLEFAY